MKWGLSTWTATVSVFWSFVDKTSSPYGCWLWIGKTRGPYGVLSFGKQYYAHRLSKCLADNINYNSTRIKRRDCCHDCPGGDNKLCVNPEHLSWKTRKQHAAETRAKNQTPSGDRHYSRSRPELVRRGEMCPWRKLSEADVRRIKRLRDQGLSQYEITNEINTSRATKITRSIVQQIVGGTRWRHIK